MTEFPVSVALGGGRRQEVRVSRSTTWEQFRQQVHLAYGLPAGSVKYIDEEGDHISLDSEAEFKEAVKVGFKLGRLKLSTADSKAPPPPRPPRPYKQQSKTTAAAAAAAAVGGGGGGGGAAPVTITFTDSPIQPSTADTTNPYIAKFLRSMSQEETKENGATAKSRSKREPRESHAPQGGGGADITAAKKPRVQLAPVTTHVVTEAKTRGYRRAPRVEHQVKTEDIRKKLEKMEISTTARPRNHYVEEFVRELRNLDKTRTVGQPGKASSGSRLDDKAGCNPYVARYQQRVMRRNRVCPASQPNKYVVQLRRSLSEDHVSERVPEQPQKKLPEVTEMETSPPPHTLPPETGPVHCGVKCDGCGQGIEGFRYKCGNCSDYDLCEKCEKTSDQIHFPDHIFLKVRVPCQWLGRDSSGFMRPLLPYIAYAPRELSEDQIPLLKSEVSGEATGTAATKTTAGHRVIVRPRDKLREEIKAAKKKRKEEKKMFKEERRRINGGGEVRGGGGGKEEKLDLRKLSAKLEKLQNKMGHADRGRAEFVLPPVTFEGPKSSGDHVQKALPPTTRPPPPPPPAAAAPAKYLVCKLVTETCCPQGSSIPPGVKFEKGWILRNTGTKKWKHVTLVHQGGYKPERSEVTLPVIFPGENVEVKVQYPPVTPGDDIQIIESSWNLIHKQCTAFGPTLTVSVVVETPQAMLPPSLPPSSSTANEDLLRSIGFLPTEKGAELTTPPAEQIPSYPDFEVIQPLMSEEGEKKEGHDDDSSIQPAFVMVENPCSAVVSLSSTDSFHQPPPTTNPPPPAATTADTEVAEDDTGDSDGGDMDQDSMESDGSDSEDDFVVVIPDCFNLNVPLPTQHMTQSCEDLEITPNTHSTPPTTSNDVMTKSCDSIPAPAPSAPVFISFQPSPVPVPHTQPENQTPPEPTNEPKTTGASPRSGRRSFVPERVTLREVKDARLRNPLTVATGLLNTVSDLVEGLNLSGKRRGGGADRDGRKPESTVAEGEENQEGETFVDCPEPSAPPLPAAAEEPPTTGSLFSSWQDCLPKDCTWLQQSDVTQFVRSDSQKEQVMDMVQREWKTPDLPDDPIEKLVAMGFGNRELNQQLLEKHNYQLQAVTNELLDMQNSGRNHWATTRH